jgi:hypothetical protein
LDLRPGFPTYSVDQTRLAANASELCELGVRWAFFYEDGAFEGEVWTNAVHLGADPLAPQLYDGTD